MLSEIAFNIIFVGDHASGKTSIIQRYCKNLFPVDYSPSLEPELSSGIRICGYVRDGIEYNLPVRFQIWDTPGLCEHRQMVRNHLGKMNCYIIVCDVSDPHALHSLQSWWDDIVQTGGAQALTLVVGNKIDVDRRTLSYGEISETVRSVTGRAYMEVSARNNEGISDLFTVIGDQLLKQFPSLVESHHEEKYDLEETCFCSIQ